MKQILLKANTVEVAAHNEFELKISWTWGIDLEYNNSLHKRQILYYPPPIPPSDLFHLQGWGILLVKSPPSTCEDSIDRCIMGEASSSSILTDHNYNFHLAK